MRAQKANFTHFMTKSQKYIFQKNITDLAHVYTRVMQDPVQNKTNKE
jgi:hypothetical protein